MEFIQHCYDQVSYNNDSNENTVYSTAYIFDGTIILDEEWDDDLLDANSSMYQNISSILSSQVTHIR